RVPSTSGNSSIKIWDANSGTCLQTLEGHGYYVSSMSFLHDSTLLASASHSRTVTVRDASSGAACRGL
ncbi:hypothetical protein EJ02DRAFT_327361, partial [Clathrospora elynae]